MSQLVQVAVGVITRVDDNNQREFFLTKRAEHVHQGGKWEFPGGKVEDGETVAQALARELNEEVGIEVLSGQPLTVITHDYGDKCVSLEVFIVENFLHEPTAQEGQLQGWFSLPSLKTLDFPAANQTIIELLDTLT
ncbi:8-oxo-dGTP diphosphatase MutT [Colwellia asteriadis]|uniref:8-oxo-dGTP diphosphatase n=1 Tax=Colwellia asteriadis TaxID=517723 RepID=A0ABN1L5D8_9GAMM